MQDQTDHIDFNDPRSTAAAALLIAHDLAPLLRTSLPVLLGQPSPGGLGVIADRMEGVRLFENFTIRSLEGVLAHCKTAVAKGTTHRVDWVVARNIGGDDDLEPVEVDDLTPSATKLVRIVASIGHLLRLVIRTEALMDADKFLSQRR